MPLDARDRDIRTAMKDLLEATHQFDVVSIGDLPESGGWKSGALRGANIDPWNDADADFACDSDGPILMRSSTVKVTFIAKAEDTETATNDVELLMNVAANAWNGVSLAGLTYPDKTRITNRRWLKPEPPERRCEVTFAYSYEIPEFDAFDETE